MRYHFDTARARLEDQFSETPWIESSGISVEELEAMIGDLECSYPSRAIVKARTFALIAEHGRIAVDREDIFQDKLMGGKIMGHQRKRWENEVKSAYLAKETEENSHTWKEYGAFHGASDYGHTSPNSRLLLDVGLTGLLDRIECAARKDGLTERQAEFYESCEIVLRAMIHVAERLSAAVKPYNEENSLALSHIAAGKPQNIYEAMQLLILYFFMHEYVMGTRVRTLGRLDVLLDPFYQRDLESGTYTKDEIKEMLRFFLFKFWSAKVPYDLPFCLGGIDEDGNEVTNEMSYLIVETYNELNIYSPKIHVRVSEKTPERFVRLVLSCIRGGNSSFVFVNDTVAVRALTGVGISEREARDYVPIGCYEPAVWGVEIGCTGNGGVNLVKALEFVLCGGRDQRSGAQVVPCVGTISSYDAFIDALKRQIAYMADRAMRYTTAIEGHYGKVNPDPLLSCQYDRSVERGVDVYEGGAKYNNSSLYFYGIATLVDAICAFKTFVFDEKRLTSAEFGEILKANWSGHEKLRAEALRLPAKYGNSHPLADAVAVEFSDFCAELVNNRPNGRGGVFKAALFSIDLCFYLGERTMATPDGRRAGDPLSKNLCATTAMDQNGITALIGSVTKMDHAKFPNGSVLDVVLHPSAVMGEDGLHAFYGILTTYFALGGFAMHGNVFSAEALRKAQRDPEKYKNLQVRVCGWNAYFVSLTRAEQDAFIRQSENAT